MARPLRIEYPGAVYHVMSRGDGRDAIVTSNDDRRLFLDVLTRSIRHYNLVVHGWCLMENHYHLLVETPDGNLSEGMHFLNGTYTQAYNFAHGRVGHVYQGRYKAILVQKEEYLLTLIRYIEMNPVKAGLVAHPKEWKWSSYRYTAGYRKTPEIPMQADWVLAQFNADKKRAQALYRTYVTSGGFADPFENVVGQSILGNDGFVAKFFDRLQEREKITEIPRKQRYQGRPPLDVLFGDEVTSRAQRNSTIEEALIEYGYSQREIADHLGLHYSSISKVVSRAVPDKDKGRKSRFKT